MQNVVLFMEPSEKPYNISLKAGNMLLNRFCIDEDDAVESSGVYFLNYSLDLRNFEAKGIEYSFLLWQLFL